jgi:hypothetical protein
LPQRGRRTHPLHASPSASSDESGAGLVVALCVGGTRKIRIRPPNTKEGNARTFRNTNDVGGDRESPKDCSRLKSCECFYACPRTTFIGRRRDFYILKIPSNLRNIPSVNM